MSVTHSHPSFLHLSSQDIQLNVNESLYDTSKVLTRFNDLILARVNSNSTIETLAKECGEGRVINALCDMYHPLQTLADLMTLEEQWGRGGCKGKTLAWVGDGNNVIHDLMVGFLLLEGNVNVATPVGYECHPTVLSRCAEIVEENGTRLTTTADAKEACTGADVVVTDTWVSMGEEDMYEKKVRADFLRE